MDKTKDAKSAFGAAVSVLQAGSSIFATIVFFPGVLLRVGTQLAIAGAGGAQIRHNSFMTEFGGEIEQSSGPRRWSSLMFGTWGALIALGSVLLYPAALRYGALAVPPFVSVSTGLVLSHSTSYRPLLDTYATFGPIEFARLWFGVSAFYACVPSKQVVDEASIDIGTKPRGIVRGAVHRGARGMTFLFRGLHALDTALTLGFAGTYLASGLFFLLLAWWLLQRLSSMLG